jgi:predicted nuclease of restriction endonuclease-like (RecB) superfamily
MADIEKFSGYPEFLGTLKERIRSAQVKAAVSVNIELVSLYWQIGRDILGQQARLGWGAGVIERLSRDLKASFPGQTGFSPRNLKYMRKFAELWGDEEVVQRVVARLSWGQNISLMEKLDTQEERLWYARKALENGWSRDVLAIQIETRLIDRQGRAPTNFQQALPPPHSDLAQQVLKDPYNLEFLTLQDAVRERDLEHALVEDLRRFLLELGAGFAFVGRQSRIEVAGDEFFTDLLFYHVRLHCYVVIDLKVGTFKPEYIGKMNFYVNAVDAKLRDNEVDRPTIGLILCKAKKNEVVEFALRGTTTPIGVSTYTLAEPEKKALALEEIKTHLTEVDADLSGPDRDE